MARNPWAWSLASRKAAARGRDIPLPQHDDPAQRRHAGAVARIRNRDRLLDGFPRGRKFAGPEAGQRQTVAGFAAALSVLDLHDNRPCDGKAFGRSRRISFI